MNDSSSTLDQRILKQAKQVLVPFIYLFIAHMVKVVSFGLDRCSNGIS